MDKRLIVISLLLVVIGLLINAFNFNPSIKGSFDEFIKKGSNLLLLISTLIIAPIIEELVFRGWVIKRKYSIYISLTSVIIFGFFSANLITALVIVFITLLWFVFKRNKQSVILLNSISFALLHLNFSNFLILNIGVFLYTFGLGLFFSVIALKKGLGYAMIIHSSVNLIVIIVGVYSSKSPDCLSNDIIENQVRFTDLEYYQDQSFVKKSDTIYLFGSLQYIASRIQTNISKYESNYENRGFDIYYKLKLPNNKNDLQRVFALIAPCTIQDTVILENYYTLEFYNEPVNISQIQYGLITETSLKDYLHSKGIVLEITGSYVFKIDTKFYTIDNIDDIIDF
ncbi:MAG: CPBP family intramembrane metalloprotease [Bacteroidales bacterium]|nr:CPBP family intramembrane metalloprotease [Bacteroidales bacterium]